MVSEYVIWLSESEYKELSKKYQMEKLSDYVGEFYKSKQILVGKKI